MKKDNPILLNAFVITQTMVIELCDLLKLVGSELHPLIQALLERRLELYSSALSEMVKKVVTEIAEVHNAPN